MEWLLDLMGYIRNLAYQSTPLENVNLKEVHAVKVLCSFQEKKEFSVYFIFFLSNKYYSPCFYVLEYCHLVSTEKFLLIFVNVCVFKTLTLK